MSDKEITIILRLTRLKLSIWPTNHYAWFGLRDFEDDTARIEEACDKLMSQLQTIISSKNFEATDLEKDMARQFSSDSVLKRNILLSPTLKPQYDEAIRKEREFLKQARAQYATKSPYQPKKVSPTSNQPKRAAASKVTTPVIRETDAKKSISRALEAIKRKQAQRHKQKIRTRVLLLLAGIASGMTLGYMLLRTQF